jgi:hypothetical protein
VYIGGMEARHLTTAEDVIRTLGKPTQVGRLVGRSAQSVVNWRRAKRLPADTFLVLSKELEQRGYTAAPSVWGIMEPEREAAE